MSTLSGLITPNNVLTATSTATLTNKTIGFSTNTFVGALAPANGGTGLTASGTERRRRDAGRTPLQHPDASRRGGWVVASGRSSD